MHAPWKIAVNVRCMITSRTWSLPALIGDRRPSKKWYWFQFELSFNWSREVKSVIIACGSYPLWCVICDCIPPMKHIPPMQRSLTQKLSVRALINQLCGGDAGATQGDPEPLRDVFLFLSPSLPPIPKFKFEEFNLFAVHTITCPMICARPA